MALTCLFFFFFRIRRPPRSPRPDSLFPSPTLFRSPGRADPDARCPARPGGCLPRPRPAGNLPDHGRADDRPRRRRHGRPERAGMTTHEHRSEEHTSELQSLMRITYAVFWLKQTKTKRTISNNAQIDITKLQTL